MLNAPGDRVRRTAKPQLNRYGRVSGTDRVPLMQDVGLAVIFYGNL
jgi:hypothetical protein